MAKEEVKTQKKLTYEELRAYASQASAAAQHYEQENTQLKQMINEMRTQMDYTIIGYEFKVLEHKEMFSKEFVQKAVDYLENVLTPQFPEESEESADKE